MLVFRWHVKYCFDCDRKDQTEDGDERPGKCAAHRYQGGHRGHWDKEHRLPPARSSGMDYFWVFRRYFSFCRGLSSIYPPVFQATKWSNINIDKHHWTLFLCRSALTPSSPRPSCLPTCTSGTTGWTRTETRKLSTWAGYRTELSPVDWKNSFRKALQ